MISIACAIELPYLTETSPSITVLPFAPVILSVNLPPVNSTTPLALEIPFVVETLSALVVNLVPVPSIVIES